jgi:hypothetical protein
MHGNIRTSLVTQANTHVHSTPRAALKDGAAFITPASPVHLHMQQMAVDNYTL